MPVRDGAPQVFLAEPPAPAPRLCLGTPMYGGLAFDGYQSGVFDLQGECARRGVALGQVILRNESDIRRGRNNVLHRFLHSDATHLLFVDADITFAARDALRLVAHAQANPDAIVGATYRRKTLDRHDYAFVPLPHGTAVLEAELVEVLSLPGGFMCISRHVAERMAGAHHADWYTDSNLEGAKVIDLAAPIIDPATRVYWSEDYAICRRWRALGGRVLLDPNIQLGHTGTITLDGDPRALLRPLFATKPQPGGGTGDGSAVQMDAAPAHPTVVELDTFGRRIGCIA